MLRFLAGDFWVPCAKPQGEGITFEGDPEAVPKTDRSWREKWKWSILRSPRTEYRMYFSSGRFSMFYIRTIRTKCVAVRIGPDAVTFYARAQVHGTLEVFGLSKLSHDSKEKLEERISGTEGISADDVTWI